MVDEKLLKRIASYAELKPGERVLEIGAGRGALTDLLIGETTAIEKDEFLFQELQERFKENVTLILGDALKIEFPEFDKFVANIPYKISKPLLLKLLQCEFKEAVIVTQKEFAEKLVAKPGEKNYGILAAFLSSQAEAEILERVPKNAFAPQPKVESAVVRIRRLRKPLPQGYLDFLKRLFVHRGTTLRKLLSAPKELSAKRVNDIKPSEFLELYANG